MAPIGLLNVNKPGGRTSRRVVDRVQRLVRPAKAGHAGTLDPLASGVLVVCVGGATRLIEYVQQMPKRYTGTFLLGRHSPTEDVDGEVTELVDPPTPTAEQIAAAAAKLTGEIQQRPPAFSALKVKGRRAYDLARQGKTVELKPRPVTVYGIDVVGYAYPELTLEIACGSGTYVRSLGRDLAESLGTAAVMSALVRTAIGGFCLEDAIDAEQLSADNWRGLLLPPLRAVEALPRIELTAEQVTEIHHGRMIQRSDFPADVEQLAAVDASGRLAAILRPRGKDRLGPLRNFSAQE